MPTCQNCGNEWSWKQTIKTLFKLKCPHCGEKQYESASSRRWGGMFVLIPLLLIMPVNIWLEMPIVVAILLVIIFLLIMFSTYPFILKLSNEEEPYW
ncbi:TIGR04104 family putative zinc finger protein [Virgibacillus ihumii]|uniref:TIGR04104 family putative zinc finger protein n=1 Tax=Virgibacillus ihumii TaxID=2686091 RepID=UPI00157CA674|nr:TIGR04104 family putative zinc finger protein [Virgibacillus ihumii]